jgi:hypothetical protein
MLASSGRLPWCRRVHPVGKPAPLRRRHTNTRIASSMTHRPHSFTLITVSILSGFVRALEGWACDPAKNSGEGGHSDHQAPCQRDLGNEGPPACLCWSPRHRPQGATAVTVGDSAMQEQNRKRYSLLSAKEVLSELGRLSRT